MSKKNNDENVIVRAFYCKKCRNDWLETDGSNQVKCPGCVNETVDAYYTAHISQYSPREAFNLKMQIKNKQAEVA